MPQFYFNVRASTDFIKDPEGSDLLDLSAARDEAIENARHAMSQAMLQGRDISRRNIVEICDEAGKILLQVPFAEAILPER